MIYYNIVFEGKTVRASQLSPPNLVKIIKEFFPFYKNPVRISCEKTQNKIMLTWKEHDFTYYDVPYSASLEYTEVDIRIEGVDSDSESIVHQYLSFDGEDKHPPIDMKKLHENTALFKQRYRVLKDRAVAKRGKLRTDTI